MTRMDRRVVVGGMAAPLESTPSTPSAMDPLASAQLDPAAVSSLPLASAAYPVLTPEERDFVLAQEDRINLADAWAFLHSRGVHSELRRNFGTPDRRRRLRHAVEVFDQQLRQWDEGPRQDPRVAWLIPAGRDVEALVSRLYGALLASQDYATFTGLHGLLRLPNAPRWTPYISAGSIRLARSLSEAHRTRLERALARGAESIGLSPEIRPWNSDHLFMNALPTSWLYQFQPTRVLGALIERGYKAGLANVGHFSILDPAVYRACSIETVKAVLMAVATRLELNV